MLMPKALDKIRSPCSLSTYAEYWPITNCFTLACAECHASVISRFLNVPRAPDNPSSDLGDHLISTAV